MHLSHLSCLDAPRLSSDERGFCCYGETMLLNLAKPYEPLEHCDLCGDEFPIRAIHFNGRQFLCARCCETVLWCSFGID